jgi:hypothetical protein
MAPTPLSAGILPMLTKLSLDVDEIFSLDASPASPDT